jgi:hypothetical protein
VPPVARAEGTRKTLFLWHRAVPTCQALIAGDGSARSLFRPTGVVMPVYEVILGSGWMALGIWTAARSVISLTIGRTKPEMTKPG